MKRTFYKITLGLLVTVSTAFAQVPTNGLVAYYPFNGNANDASGNGNNGTNNGATLTVDRFGNANSAYSFDGLSNFINISSVPVAQNVSFSFWIKSVGPNSTLITYDGSSLIAFDGSYRVVYSATKNLIAMTKAGNSSCLGNWPTTLTSDSSSRDEWAHFVWTRKSTGEQEMYINAVLHKSQLLSSANYPIGCYGGFIGALKIYTGQILDYFKGSLDDIAIYNRALTSNEVTALYNDRNTVTDIETLENVKENSFKIYPIPASNHLIVESSISGHSVLVTDAMGQTAFSSAINLNQLTINIDNWKKSLYIVKLLDTKNMVVEARKVIVQ